MIIWLASYPRSGITLLRTVLNATMGLSSCRYEVINPREGVIDAVENEFGHLPIAEPWDIFYNRATVSENVYLVKTHLPPMDDQPVIYVVRDGRLATESYAAYHQSFKSNLMFCPAHLDLMMGNDYYGSWSSHYKVWTSPPRGALLLLRYEQLVAAEMPLLEEIARFVGHTKEVKPFINPFVGLHRGPPIFFRHGRAHWQRPDHWSVEDEALFIELHGELMQRLRYIEGSERVESRQLLSPSVIKISHAAYRAFQERNALRCEAEAKEHDIHGLDSELEKREVSHIPSLKYEEKIRALLDERNRSLALLAESKAALASSEAALIEKEKVIRFLDKAVHEYRLACVIGNPFGLLRRLGRRVRRVLMPRLGMLFQYEPRDMMIPASYHVPVKLALSPRISVVTPAYNHGEFLERTIQSVLGQNYPNLEYFVQDGGSDDETMDILERYSDRLAGWESRPDNGQSQAINLGFARTRGEIMAWLNSDDLFLPGALAYVADYFNRHPEVDVVYGNRLLINENGMEIGRWIMPGHNSKVLSWVDYVPQETLFWRRSIWDKVGGHIDESFRFAMDWDLLVRFRDAGAQFAHIPRFQGAFRIHERQKTLAAINEIGHQEMDRIRERLFGRVPTRIEIRKAILPFLLKHVAVDMVYRVKTRLRSR